ncbi:molybdopterin biosynthesis protein [[Clostridium] polysaccharolyticum]|uniref:Molybdopterin molybdenumtransferase n=1 Tax=[Clostridium] polysaccharolyticum TaxID=29364 RepID=A0A1I0EFB7_9FIRM|nr:molybdopterin biosynthesis protein [[Clostridium] polysaccharolyticum]SET43230.1 putative molybdopterin biosynthesis protein [[Clostridium] polysaccharolyticum]
MGFQYLTNTSLEQAIMQYRMELDRSGFCRHSEKIPVIDAINRITSKAVYAKLCSPHYNACAMDGIALKADTTFGATETSPVKIRKDAVVYVDTGDPLPKECDCVVMIEDVIKVDAGILLYHAAAPWQHVRQIGEDMSAGDMILTSFSQITPVAIGAMLACGVLEVEVVKKPIVGIIPTGDEIVQPDSEPEEGKIKEFNSAIFGGMVHNCGACAKVYPIVKDQKEELENMLRKAIKECDVAILIAGSSAGREDYSSEVINSVGKVIFHGIAMKPGKPAVLGMAGSVPVIGLPGYPVSGIIVFQNIVEPLLEYLTGQNLHKEERKQEAVLTKNYNSSLSYREFVRTRLGYVNGRMIATPLNGGAGVVSSFLKADGIIDIPKNSEGGERGETMSVKLLKSKKEVQQKLIITGSHDPLIDEITDIMVRQEKGFGIVSSHVGSMGAIFAVKRKEAHLGAIHLLDEETGRYNTSYVKKYFPSGGVKVVEGVKRVQGFMVQKGNPKGIHHLRDILRQDISYVNRQKGSGTRILTDYLIKKEGLVKDKIRGYEREEFTHTSVAAIVAAGSADVGMGIYSAARIYGLDFIPICEEHYDFLVDDETLELEEFQEFLKIMKGEELKARLGRMGGYVINNSGCIVNLE